MIENDNRNGSLQHMLSIMTDSQVEQLNSLHGTFKKAIHEHPFVRSASEITEASGEIIFGSICHLGLMVYELEHGVDLLQKELDIREKMNGG